MPVGLSQLLRPHVITTQQFGGLWPAHAAEKKQVSHAGRFASHPQAFMEMLTATLNLHQVRAHPHRAHAHTRALPACTEGPRALTPP